jgi:hypothetical protein
MMQHLQRASTDHKQLKEAGHETEQRIGRVAGLGTFEKFLQQGRLKVYVIVLRARVGGAGEAEHVARAAVLFRERLQQGQADARVQPPEVCNTERAGEGGGVDWNAQTWKCLSAVEQLKSG